ncbi:DMT family transporter, partial [Tabrizicola sp.]|uniref:DMT family transporter n=1 Tax=Tabrizicola sp. TaxID=2005166 RepID=UPI003F415E4F
MPSPKSGYKTNSGLGISLMALAMFVVPLVDGVAKLLSDDFSSFFIAWARYAMASAIVLPVAATLHGRHFLPSEKRISHTLRAVFLVAATTLYFLSITTVPLTTAVSAYFVGPIIAAILASFVLGETLTLTKFASLGLGFAGSLVVLRPGPDIEPGILLALGAGALFALYLIATRWAATTSDPMKTLAFQCVIGTALLTPMALLTWLTPSLNLLLMLCCLGFLSAISHFLSIAAFRLADASTLSPLVYLELLG